MKYVPSPIQMHFSFAYSALANKSGRMQYYRMSKTGKDRARISRSEFIHAFNNYKIIAMQPLQAKDVSSVFQLEFYI